MYREDGWIEGFYMDNHKKFECRDCGKQFIVGEESTKYCPPGFPVCPYCGQHNIECISWTEDDQLQELNSYMGCIAIYVDENQTISESGKEEAWQRIQCYIDCHNYDWTFERIKNDYQKYYINGSQISYSLLDIITHNEMECKLLFENQN